jgi:hypothetical protein
MYPGFPLNFVNLPIFAEYTITHFDQNIIYVFSEMTGQDYLTDIYDNISLLFINL